MIKNSGSRGSFMYRNTYIGQGSSLIGILRLPSLVFDPQTFVLSRSFYLEIVALFVPVLPALHSRCVSNRKEEAERGTQARNSFQKTKGSVGRNPKLSTTSLFPDPFWSRNRILRLVCFQLFRMSEEFEAEASLLEHEESVEDSGNDEVTFHFKTTFCRITFLFFVFAWSLSECQSLNLTSFPQDM